MYISNLKEVNQLQLFNDTNNFSQSQLAPQWQRAIELHQIGFCIGGMIHPDEKHPNHDYKHFRDNPPSLETIKVWAETEWDFNYAILTGKPSGIVVIEADDEEAYQLVLNRCPPTPMMQRSGSDKLNGQGSVHFVYGYQLPDGWDFIPSRQQIKVEGKQYHLDVRADKGLIVGPQSLKSGQSRRYTEVAPWTAEMLASLPVFNPSWLDYAPPDAPSVRLNTPPSHPEVSLDRKQLWARDWLTKRKGAEQSKGAGADNYCYAITCELLWGWDLTKEGAFPLVLEWGEQASNTDANGGYYGWSESEIWHKLDDAEGKPNLEGKSKGYLLALKLDEELRENRRKVEEMYKRKENETPLDGEETEGIENEPTEPKGEKDKRDYLLEKVKSLSQLWHSPDKNPYATLPSGCHVPVSSSAFAHWLQAVNLDLCECGLTESAVKKAVATCSALSLHRGSCHKVYRRVARIGDVIEIDLGDNTYEAVVITPDGWTIRKPSARFVRSDNAAPLPHPVRGGSVDALRPFVNLSDEQFPLFIGSILDAVKGTKDYLVSALIGEQETGKSAMLRIMKRLIDPAIDAELPAPPKNEEDLAIECNNCHFVVYDNVGKIPEWLSDAYCRVATGSGVKTRTLYTNKEQTIHKLLNPVALNGIEDFVVKGDLVRRTVIMQSEPMPNHAKQDDFWDGFNEVYPAVLGVIYDALALGLRTHRESRIEAGGMSDSANWIAACVPVFGWTFETWHEPYLASREMAHVGLLENSTPYTCLIDWFKDKNAWEGTATELHEKLTPFVPYGKMPYFPANGQSLSSHFRRLAPSLRTVGIDFKSGKKKTIAGKQYRLCVINRIDPPIRGTQGTQGTQGAQQDATKNGIASLADPVKKGKNEQRDARDAKNLSFGFQEKDTNDLGSINMREESRESMANIASLASHDAKTPKNTASSWDAMQKTTPPPCVTLASPRIRIRPLRNGMGYYVEDLHRKQKNGEPHILAHHLTEEDAQKDADKLAEHFARTERGQ